MKVDRRDFLKQSGVLTASLTLSTPVLSSLVSGCSSAHSLDMFGLQLYTLRDILPDNPQDVLKQVAGFGYKQIESYAGPSGIFWGMTNKEFKKFMSDLGMTLVSSHCDINNDFERLAAEAGEIGMKYLISPSDEGQKTIDDFKRTADKYNEMGSICKKNGLRFAYHNHDFTFIEMQGQIPERVLLENTDADLVDFQLDLYWIITAGQNPEEWLKNYKNRFRLCHVKDRQIGATEREATCTLGTGSIDYQSLLSVARSNGMQYYIVEQEHYGNNTPLGCAKEDAEYLSKLVI